MRYGSVCSGIEAATVAWHPIGWEAAWYSEIEPFPCAVLKHHYPAVPNYGDMTKYEEWPDEPINLLVGGTPCQSFSVAGLRKGLADPRGNLMLTYGAIARRYRPEWLVWENVPGVLSSNGGRDFGTFLGMLAELGYGFAYRVLDAQYFGVAQRRRRVFVVGHLGNWQRAAAVLFERHSLQGHPAPSREKGQGTAAHVEGGVADVCPTLGCELTKQVNNQMVNNAEAFYHAVAQPIPYDFFQITAPVNRQSREPGDPCHTLARDNAAHATIVQPMAFPWQSALDPIGKPENLSGTLIKNQTMAVAQPTYGIPGNWIGRQPENGGNAVEPMHDVSPCLTKTDRHGVAQPVAFSAKDHGADATLDLSPTLRAMPHNESHANGGGQMAVVQPVAFDPYNQAISEVTHTLRRGSGPSSDAIPQTLSAMQVRRLTPVECERLQGFPDNYTNIPWRKKPDAPDGPRYKSLGNSMAVPVMRWIGERIAKVDAK